jgi:hypothetical protein
LRLPEDKSGHADIALNRLISCTVSSRDLKEVGDEYRHESRQQNSLPVLMQLQAWLVRVQPRVTRLTHCANGLRRLVNLQVHHQ